MYRTDMDYMGYLYLSQSGDFTFNGLRITPRAIFFKNLMIGKTYRERIRLQNISSNPITIWTYLPDPCTFKLDNSLCATTLSSGLTVYICIVYTHQQNLNAAATLTIYVNDECMFYPLNVCMTFSYMYSVPRIINFGKINLANSIYSQILTVHNKGFKTSKFLFDLGNNSLGLLVKPLRGFIEPNSYVAVEISIVGIEEGQFYKEIWIKCDYPFCFAVTVEVVKPKLYIEGPQKYTDSFLPIQFPPTYAPCKNFKTLTLSNHNLLETNYIIVPEFHLDVMAMHKVKELEPGYTSFNFLPAVDGHLKPNEKKKIHITFQANYVSPKKNDRVFFVCYRLLRIDIVSVNKLMLLKTAKKNMALNFIGKHRVSALEIDNISSELQAITSNSQISQTSDIKSSSLIFGDQMAICDINGNKGNADYIRLCCYAIVKPVQVEVFPTTFQLGLVKLNDTKKLKITMYNRSKVLPIFFEYVKTAYIDMMPPKGKLLAKESIEITLNISPKRTGVLDCKVKFDLLYYSHIVHVESELIKVGKVFFNVDMNVSFPTSKLKPKFNTGLTPVMNGNAVGFLTDDIRFNTDIPKPRMAMLCSYKANPSLRYDDAKIAFPNDRPAMLPSWRIKDGRCKTVFAGMPRSVVPLDSQYALTSQAELKKQINLDYYERYLQKQHIERLKTLPPGILPDYITAEQKLLMKVKKPFCPVYEKNENKSIQNGYPALTPSQTYFIHVKPLKINLGKVVLDSICPFNIVVENDNKFSCHVELKTLHADSNVFPSLPQTEVLNASISKTFKDEFHPSTLGSFYTILNVFINNRHSLPITFQADVVRPFVHLETHSILFDDKDVGEGRYVKLSNTLNVPVSFNWQIPKLTCYNISPKQGCIPVERFIMCEVHYKPDSIKRSNARLQCICPGGNSSLLEVNAYLLKCDVEYLYDKIHIPAVPINIPITKTNILRNNASQSVSFSIRNMKPCHGVTIEPAFGTIWARSDFEIKIIVHYKFFAKFECRVETDFEHGNCITFIVSGEVDYPKIRFKPENSRVLLKRIPAESFDIYPFSIINKSNSEINITLDSGIFPEITISPHSDYLESHEKLDVYLAPSKEIELYIHFYPLDVCMNDFYIPFVINKILGPPSKGEPDTVKIAMYTNEFITEEIREGLDEYVKLIKYKIHSLPTLTVCAISSRHVLRFNKTYFKFKYFPLENYPSKLMQELKIKNSFSQPVEFSLHLIGVHPHFDIFSTDCKEWSTLNNFMYCKVEPKEEIMLVIRFVPINPGTIIRRIEVRIKDVKNNAVFANIKLRGRYLEATIKIPPWIFLEPVPLRNKLKHELKLKLRNHLPDCSITVSCTDKNFLVTIDPSTELEFLLLKDVTMNIEFVSDVAKQVYAIIFISCTCGTKVESNVTAAADENIATVYTHFYRSTTLQPNVVTSKYFPLFPSKTDKSKLAIYLRKCKKIVERWIYEQVLHMSFYYFIPDSMMGLYKYSRKSKSNKIEMLALVKIMQNICGDDILELFLMRPFPENSDLIEQINYKHSVFNNILIFLKERGAFLPHVRARFLLDHKEYVIYCTKIRVLKQKEPIDYDDLEEHHLRCEQCWLDLILQLFKSLVLASIVMPKARTTVQSVSSSTEPSQFVDSQQALLHWLNTVYASQISILMSLDSKKPANFVLQRRRITNFTHDLEDGIVFTAVTICYCPYLDYILKDIYIKVDGPDKSFHNAVLLTKAWSKVKCSFKILPEEITTPHALQMLMFVTYMYLVFPLLRPKAELKFDVSLSFMATHDIVLKNPGAIDLNFDVSVLNNSMDCFQILPPNFVRVPASKDIKIKVTYQAKKVQNVKAVLVLSGDTPGEPYSKSIIYILHGMTNFEKAHENIELQVDLYSIEERDILIRTPYKCETTYALIIDKCNLQDFNSQLFESWQRKSKVLLPKSLYCRNCTLATNELGAGTITLTICSISTSEENMLLVFQNEKVGEFIITVAIQPINFQKISKYQFNVALTEAWDNDCICGKNKFIHKSKCPRYLTIDMPCRNDLFWTAIKDTLLLAVPQHEKSIWIEYLNGDMGPYLLNWLLVAGNDTSSNVKYFFTSDITYKVTSTSHFLQFPSRITIPNMRSNDTIPIEVHVSGSVQVNKIYDISLQSEDGGDFRIYSFQFTKKLRKSKVKSMLPD